MTERYSLRNFIIISLKNIFEYLNETVLNLFYNYSYFLNIPFLISYVLIDIVLRINVPGKFLSKVKVKCVLSLPKKTLW